ncbi:glycosyltransferase [candidate division KSB1 bacterium]|nr:glycosyltransferase [candidate division KSB1 bacterium]RQW04128.1 MAG: glycosyltransferase [candidate division KSB1 bacterium]
MTKQIVCISQHYWDDRWFRKHHFMSRFARDGYRIAFVEPSITLVKKAPEGKEHLAQHDLFDVKVHQKDENIFILKPPRALPLWNYPVFSKLAFDYFAKKVQKKLQELGFSKFILWDYIPLWVDSLKHFDYSRLVFDIADNLPEFYKANKLKYWNVKRACDKLATMSDLVLVSASSLYDQFLPKTRQRNIHIAPNGFDMDRFRQSNGEVPEELKNVKKPIVGFIGTIFPFLDFDLINYVVDNNKDKTFVFVGGCDGAVKEHWMPITAKPNVLWLGRRAPQTIPSYIRLFDVCLNPFRVDSISEAVNPLKAFEYVAAEKPVVSVRMLSLEREKIAQYIEFANDYQEFDLKLNRILAERKKPKVDEHILLSYTWEEIYQKVHEEVERLLVQ